MVLGPPGQQLIASALFADRVPKEDAVVVQRLRSGGAVLLGKLNMHEFALGTTSAISHFGQVRNPWDMLEAALLPSVIVGG